MHECVGGLLWLSLRRTYKSEELLQPESSSVFYGNQQARVKVQACTDQWQVHWGSSRRAERVAVICIGPPHTA